MDPVSALAITSSCITVAAKSGTLILRIGIFVSEVKNARKDLDAVSRELASLQLCLSALKDDQQLGALHLPEEMKTQTNQILLNIDLILNQISDVLIKLSSGKLGRRIQWATMQRDEINRFHSSLESNKTALEIALTVGSISMLTQQMQSSTRRDNQVALLIQKTESISLKTGTIDGKLDILTDMHRDNTRFDDLAQEIQNLRTHMTNAAIGPSNSALNTFRSNSEAYTQSLLQPLQAAITDQRVAQLIDLSTESTSNSSRTVDCNCKAIYEAKQQDSEVRLERSIAGYRILHARNLDALKENENTTASYRQYLQREVSENVRLQEELVGMKKQIAENAKIITALNTSHDERDPREHASALPQQIYNRQTRKPQSAAVQSEEPLTGISRTSRRSSKRSSIQEPLTDMHGGQKEAQVHNSNFLSRRNGEK